MLPPHPLYYLHNFQRALDWLAARYGDLFDDTEQAFLDAFAGLPEASRALLVRLLGRKGELFRSDRLRYEEIGDVQQAAEPLLALGWLSPDPLLDVEALLRLYTKAELAALADARLRKDAMREQLLQAHPQPRHHRQWRPQAGEQVWKVDVQALCDRLRLMFFGNLRQQWDEQLLADIGVFQYERVPLDAASRAFQTRADVDQYLQLHLWREQLETAGPTPGLLDAVLDYAPAHPWLAMRRAKLLLRLGQASERVADWAAAQRAYAASAYRGARHRRLRVLERQGAFEQAYALARQAQARPEDDSEAQRLARMLPRLCRQLGLARPTPVQGPAIPLVRLQLPRTPQDRRVEDVARQALAEPGAVVCYVENALVNSLFGLLCWDAVFAPLPGAFFHPFQRGPADLASPDFARRRQALFDGCLGQLDDGRYRATIEDRYVSKQGLQSPFVAWDILTPDLLALALDCMAPADLRSLFERLLQDVPTYRSGLPDLIRFWPQQRRYELIEVKGPGDRLQDNQIGWLQHCLARGVAVQVCHIAWDDACA